MNTSTQGNILLVANWESNVGYAWWLMENFWVAIAEHFGQRDRASYLIYPRITRLPASIAASEIEVFECDFRDRSFSNLARLRELVKTRSIRNIYLSDAPAYSLMYVLLRLWGIKRIVIHDHTPGERTIPSGWLRRLKRSIHKLPLYTANHYIAVTDYVYRRFIDVGCIPARKCSVAPNGIAPIDLDKADPKYAHRTFNIPDDRLIVIAAGRATYYKGVDFFIECADELINRQGLKQVHFLFCGDGPDLNAFRSLSLELDVGDHFTFAGKRPDIREILPSCHIGFHAASGEVGYSLSILEFMSAGLVTIVPDLPSTSLATSEGVNGLLYQPRDLSSATDAIKQGLDPQTAERIKSNAVRDIRNNYNIDNTNKLLTTILQSVFV